MKGNMMQLRHSSLSTTDQLLSYVCLSVACYRLQAVPLTPFCYLISWAQMIDPGHSQARHCTVQHC